MKTPILYTPDTLDEFSWQTLSTELDNARAENSDTPILLRINGNGGNVYHAMALYDQIQADGNIIGMATGRVYSAHVRVWLACKERRISPSAVIGLHSTRNEYAYSNAKDMHLARVEMERQTDWLIDALATLSGRTSNYWRNRISMAGEEFYRLSATECLEHKLAHAVGWQ